jgi:hypothetical protein
VGTLGEKLLQASGGERDGIGPCDPDDVEAQRACSVAQLALEGCRLVQKSRFA